MTLTEQLRCNSLEAVLASNKIAAVIPTNWTAVVTAFPKAVSANNTRDASATKTAAVLAI